ncbi:NADH-quinone oxidoreductase subunit L [candidate division LCP-89 bacterium B3_LCP]|uniref:NADH-quinone oxidoreductase subunit L n=1 Tax=candidate division LCP-89 bacterium B3_LCP TaxID=2012998 RepID=A0A532USP9_UNCL8|nr:MAG: NADH-quinone oxidoreductase subunit L [candidate division LCP-89 bacterium B3_LCP]
MHHETITTTHSALLWLIPAFPFLGMLINGLLGKKQSPGAAGILASGAMFLSFIVSAVVFFQLLGMHAEERSLTQTLYTWMHVGDFSANISFLIDPLSAVMILVVTGVGFLIHVYSIGYMKGDPGVVRYFTQLNLFAFFMLLLVMADNYLLMFVGWEGVGLCSYLLIGFWWDDMDKAIAGKKAFIVNRIGDFGFLLAMFLIFVAFGSLDFETVFARATGMPYGSGVVTAITLLLFLGACGKSAQLPLYVWLPDAMAGPTPVSALIHAATMVTAGVYMVARSNILYTLAPVSMAVVAGIGAATAIFAATIGLAQFDIKKVLAYSTVSQLGYMFLACGVGAFGAGIFHLMTHAFFKALLFMGSGSIIHAMHHYMEKTGSHDDPQDMRNMGGLRKHMPKTYWTFLLATLAIAGIPGFSGFFSKDEILWKAFSSGNIAVWVIGAIAAGLTAFYMFRLVYMTFFGEFKPAQSGEHPHESPSVMTVPLMILAVLSIIGGWVGIPHVLGGGNHIEHWFHPVFAGSEHISTLHQGHGIHSSGIEMTVMIVSVLIALAGIGIAYLFYIKKTDIPGKIVSAIGPLHKLVYNKYFVDEIYEAGVVTPIEKTSDFFLWRFFDVKIVDGMVNGAATVVDFIAGHLRKVQTGFVQNYALIMGAAVLVIVLVFVW